MKDGAREPLRFPAAVVQPHWPLDPPTIKLNIEEARSSSGIVDFEVEAVGETEIGTLYFYIGGDQRQPRKEPGLRRIKAL